MKIIVAPRKLFSKAATLLTVIVCAGLFVGASSYQGGDKETICHFPPGNLANPQTIEVSVDALPAHAAHGDFKGTCDGGPDPV